MNPNYTTWVLILTSCPHKRYIHVCQSCYSTQSPMHAAPAGIASCTCTSDHFIYSHRPPMTGNIAEQLKCCLVDLWVIALHSHLSGNAEHTSQLWERQLPGLCPVDTGRQCHHSVWVRGNISRMGGSWRVSWPSDGYERNWWCVCVSERCHKWHCVCRGHVQPAITKKEYSRYSKCCRMEANILQEKQYLKPCTIHCNSRTKVDFNWSAHLSVVDAFSAVLLAVSLQLI